MPKYVCLRLSVTIYLSMSSYISVPFFTSSDRYVCDRLSYSRRRRCCPIELFAFIHLHCQNAFQNMLLSHMNLWPLINLFAFNVCIAYETHRKHRKDHTILFIYSSVFSLSFKSVGSLFFLYISCMAFFSQLPLRCLDFSTRCLHTS